MRATRIERVPGGLAQGKTPQEFDPVQLRKGTEVELEHTSDWDVAEEIAMDHLTEDPDYYVKLATIESHEHTPNRSMPRVRTYDAIEIASKMRETFADRPVERRERLSFSWPSVMQNVGDSLAVAYASDKWKQLGASGKREVELYKHLAESRNVCLAAPGVMYDRLDPSTRWTVIGPMVSLASCPMPKHFAVLGLFEEIDLKLHTGGTDEAPRFGRSADSGVVHVQVRNGHLGGSKILWSRLGSDRKDEPFIFVYTKDAGVMFMVFGEQLDVEKDGIVG